MGARWDALRERLAGWEGPATRLVSADSRRAGRIALVTLIAVTTLAEAALWTTGCTHQYAMPWDSAYLLEMGWRVHTGEIPHRDFATHIGMVPSLLTSLTFTLTGVNAKALVYGPAMLFPLIVFGGWWLARARFPAFFALLFSLLAGFLLVGMFPLGFPGVDFRLPSFAMQYNRLGWALISLLALQVSLRPRVEPTRAREWAEGIASGVILGILLFLKLNYFAAGIALLATGSMAQRPKWGSVAAGFAVTALALLACLRFDVGAIIADAGEAGQAAGAGRLLVILTVLRESMGEIALLVLVALFLVRPAAARGGMTRPFVSTLAVAALGIMICAGSNQVSRLPLLAVAAMLLVEHASRPGATEPSRFATHRLFAAAVAVVLVAGTLVPDAMSVGNAWRWRWFHLSHATAPARVDSPALVDMACPALPDDPKDAAGTVDKLLHGGDYLTPRAWAVSVNDALRLARANLQSNDRVVMLEWYNPMPLALGMPAPRGYSTARGYGKIPPEKRETIYREIFANVTLVLVPKYPPKNWGAKTLREAYGALIARDFEKVAESELWDLRRRSGTGSVPGSR